MKIPNDIINIVRKIKYISLTKIVIKQYHQIYEIYKMDDTLKLKNSYYSINRRYNLKMYTDIYKLGTLKYTARLPKNYFK